ncbi:DUF2191 domain-containing protein [candidate division KSB1 bacterium]|nr:DUF2191 domain-containing protein [candidate division KSB1 bacterium]
MKVTALIPDDLIADVKQLTQGKNITDSLIKALSEWVSIQKIKSLNIQVARTPFVFKEGFSSSFVRKINRQ